jgi:transposase-like protein
MKSSGNHQIDSEIEFDEICLGESDKKFDKGRAVIKVVVQVHGDNQKMGRAYLEHIQSQKSEAVKKFINKTVEPGSVIRTDGKKTYHFLKNEYQHHHHKMCDKKDNDIHLPNVHIVTANLKMWLSGVHNHLPYKHSQRYLDEFCFRFNRRWQLDNIFDKLINRAITTPTVTYAELTG